MFLNDVSLRLCWSQRCCYPCCLLPPFPVHRSRFPAHGAHALIGVIRPFKPSNLIPGAIVPNHTVRALVTPYSAVYGVRLASSRGVPWCCCCCCRVGTAAGCCRVVGSPLQWGGVDSGYSPTIGVPLWWGAPYSGDGWIVGASQYWVRADCGLVRIVGAYLLLKL